jgi:hypothetical protein
MTPTEVSLEEQIKSEGYRLLTDEDDFNTEKQGVETTINSNDQSALF